MRRGPVSPKMKIRSWSMIMWLKPTLFGVGRDPFPWGQSVLEQNRRKASRNASLFEGGTTTGWNQAAVDTFIGSLLAWEDRDGLLQIRKQSRQLESYIKNMYIKISATDCLFINPWPKAFSSRGCQMKKSCETCSHSKLKKKCVCVQENKQKKNLKRQSSLC